MAIKRPRVHADYIKSAREHKSIVPSLSKYNRRKKLNRWEKAAITRAINNINKAARGGTIVPLTKQQVRAIKGKDLLIGHGIRAIRLRNFNPETDKLSVSKGSITTKRKGARRKWHLKRIRFRDQFQAIDQVEKFIRKKVKQNSKPVDFQVWSGAGRISIGSEGLSAIAIIAGFIGHYSGLDEDFEQWFFGVAWSVET